MSTYEISKSSLLSLKAEVLRKQNEISKVKSENNARIIKQTKKITPLILKNKGVEARAGNDIHEEDENLLKNSRIALEAKTKLYDKLTNQTDFNDEEIENNRRYLVRFEKKSREIAPPPDIDAEGPDFNRYADEEEEEQIDDDDYGPAPNEEDEWIEYVDCLGRTRKCMRKDLEFLMSKDEELRKAAGDREGVRDKDEVKKQEKLAETENEKTEFTENSEMLSADMRSQLIRRKWEKQEEELRQKSDIHYQDILFDEARTHGVGYFGFSRDEEERARQLEELKKLRSETQREQEKAQDLRKMREKQLAARVKAAKNRKRARLGLPPEEDDPEPTEDEKEEETNEEPAEPEVSEDEKQKQAILELARKQHVRPWDIGKEGVKERHVYSQEEWVDKMRKERQDEFAPPSSYRKNFHSELDPEDGVAFSDKGLYFSSKKDDRRQKANKEPEGRRQRNMESYKTKEVFDFTQASSSNFVSQPIMDECQVEEEEDNLLRDFRSSQVNCKSSSEDSNDSDEEVRGRGVEVEPPPTFDYYGPSDSKKPKTVKKNEHIVESIGVGLKFLRDQAEKKENSTKHPDEMFLF